MKTKLNNNMSPRYCISTLLATVFQLKSSLKKYWGLGFCLSRGLSDDTVNKVTLNTTRQWVSYLKLSVLFVGLSLSTPIIFIRYIFSSVFLFCQSFLFPIPKTTLTSQPLSTVSIYVREPLALSFRQMVSGFFSSNVCYYRD